MNTNKNPQKKNKVLQGAAGALQLMRKNIVMRLGLGLLTVILTVVLIFALTVAWQTNVVQSGGLTFSAETWNFSGEVTIADQQITAAPGDEGVIPLTLKNDSASIAAASITVSKDQFSGETMRQRLYFYIDTTASRNGETVDRVYLGKNTSYTYTIFPQRELLLTETIQSAPVLRWEWVYDVLGYYVIGTGSTGADVTAATVVNVEEYIRPIEYAYDPAKTTFDANGWLETTDGTTTVAELLATVSANDGYAGSIDVSKRTNAGYYPVSVNANGHGVWAYLCTQSEIAANMDMDAELGAPENQDTQYPVRITVTGQNTREVPVAVDSEEALLEALGSSAVSMVQLSGDVTLGNTVTLSSGTSTMIDLNGHTLSSSAEDILALEPDATLLVHNGTLEGVESSTDAAVAAVGADVTLEGVTIAGVAEGITVFDHKAANGADSNIYLKDCNITASMDGLWVYGNGGTSDSATKITIDNCTISGEQYAGVFCNGSQWGTDIRITNSSIKGYYTAIYHPQPYSTMTVAGSTLEGWNGLVAKGGIVNLTDCTVKGTGSYNEPQYTASGFTDTGDGIYLEANYTWETMVYISGDNTFVTSTGNGTLAVRKFEADAENADIIITGGSYSSDVSAYVEEGYKVTETTKDGATVYVVEAE